MSRPRWEILVGDTRTLDYLASKHSAEDQTHPLQELVEEVLETEFTEKEREVFYLRFGERYSIREIADALGYNSHQVIQVIIDRIKQKVREHIERATGQSSTDSHN